LSALLARRYYRRAERELENGDLEAACDSYRAASELLPSFYAARLGHAVVLARLGDPPRAAQTLRAGIARRPRSAGVRGELWRTLGDVLTKGGDYLGALDAYNEALSALAVPSTNLALDAEVEAVILSGKARVLAKLGRYAESLEHVGFAARKHKQSQAPR